MDTLAWSGKLPGALKGDDDLVKICHYISADILKGDIKLVTFVEMLGPALTNEDAVVRERGINSLVKVLKQLPKIFLKEDELNFILTFFIDRLKDHYSVVPAVLQGILCILEMQNLSSIFPAHLLTEMSKHINCQTQSQNDRFTIYNIIYQLAGKYPQDLKMLGPDFIYQVISSIDGERDPRNLMFLFQIMPGFLRSFPLGHLTEEMFEVLSCYFPVDFYSASNNPSAITRDDLAHALAACLTAVPDFAEFCLPLIFEKLDSTRKAAKLDCFYVLRCGFSTFPVTSLEEHLPQIWQKILFELIPGIDKEIRDAALETLGALVRMLSGSVRNEVQSQSLQEFVETVITAVKGNLNEVELNSFLPSIRVLLCLAEASLPACMLVVIHVVPILHIQYKNVLTSDQKTILLQALNSFLAVCDKHDIISKVPNELSIILKEIHSLYMTAVTSDHPGLQREAMCGLAVVVASLDSKSRCQLYDILTQYIKQQRNEALRQEAVNCLKQLSKLYSDEVMNQMVLCRLRIFEGGGDVNHDEEFRSCQDALCEIADLEPFTSCIIPQFINLVIESCELQKCLTGIKCLRKVMELHGEVARIYDYIYHQCRAVNCLVSWCIQNSVNEKLLSILDHPEILPLVSRVVEAIIRKQNSSIQSEVVTEFVPQFLNDQSGKILLDPKSPVHCTRLVMILESLLSSLRREVDIDSRDHLISILTSLAIETDQEIVNKSASRLVGNLINKSPETGGTLTKSLTHLLMKVEYILKSDTCCDRKKRNTIGLLVWITRGLLMKGHKEAESWVHKLIGLISDEFVSSEVANGFRVIVSEEEEYFTLKNYCNIRLLYRQHLLYITQPMLMESFQHASNLSVRCNHLLSLMYILQKVPRQVLESDLPKVIPCFVESLEQENTTLLVSTLEMLQSLLGMKQSDILEHLQTFINKLLQLTNFEHSMKVRILALQCIHLMCFYPTHLILPYKSQVLKELAKCLDDKKRLVRNEAVKARSRWFVVGSPGEPNAS